MRSVTCALLILTMPPVLRAQWVQTSLDSVSAYAFANTGTCLFAGTERGVYLSTNNGTSWTAVNSDLVPSYVLALAVSEANLFAGTWGGGVFLSTDNGTSWTAVKSDLTDTYVWALCASPSGAGGTNLFAGTRVGGVFLSTNNGTSWTSLNSGLTSNYVRAFCVSPSVAGETNLFAGTGGGVFLSTNNGTSWTEVNSGLANTNASALAVLGTNLFAGTWGGGVFLSTNNGTSWTEVNSGLTNTNVWTLAVSGTNLFAGTSGGVFLSTNNGTSWTAVNAGLTSTSLWTLAVSGTNLFAGTAPGGVWRRPLSEMVTSVPNGTSAELPTHFSLGQNYPNPFNPSTTISYQLPLASHVALHIYDLLGREVAVLVNEEKSPGNYTVTWDARGMSSRIYFCRLTAGTFVQTRKLMLVK